MAQASLASSLEVSITLLADCCIHESSFDPPCPAVSHHDNASPTPLLFSGGGSPDISGDHEPPPRKKRRRRGACIGRHARNGGSKSKTHRAGAMIAPPPRRHSAAAPIDVGEEHGDAGVPRVGQPEGGVVGGGRETQPPILARPPRVSKLSASRQRRMKSLSNRISYDKKMIAQRDSEIAQRDSEIDELQDEALDLYSQARDDDHLRQKIEEQVDVLKTTNDRISDLIKDRSA